MLPVPVSYGTATAFLAPDDRGLFSYPRDLERGALALNDPTGGLEQADWEGWFDGLTFYVRRLPGGVPIAVLTTTTAPAEGRFTFDSQMRPHVCWVEGGTAHLYWYDATLGAHTTLELAARSPRLCLDDKRSFATWRDVLLFYVVDQRLYCRQSRDRFQPEAALLLGRLPENFQSIGRVGMAENNRIQIELILTSGGECEPGPVLLHAYDMLYADATILSGTLVGEQMLLQAYDMLYADATILSGTLSGEDPCTPYERPAFDAADANFADATAYEPPAFDAADATFPEPCE